MKSRGGAGYVIVGEECEVVLAAYLTLEDAEKVLDGGGGGTGAYLKEVPVGAFDTAALGDDIADETESALGRRKAPSAISLSRSIVSLRRRTD